MIRILNFFCVALAGLACLALYRVSEQTRVANAELVKVDRQIVLERGALHVLEADWQSVASPERIQRLAQAKLGINDATTLQLTSFENLPVKGADAPLNNTPIQQASIQVATPAPVAGPPPTTPAPTQIAQTETLAPTDNEQR
jgi:hypothetical protein